MPSTAWVKPAPAITGLDHLGTQAPCIAIYSTLLPGINNVTDRATYYSFYPWLLRELEGRWTGARSGAGFIDKLRRAECLLTLIASRHEHKVDGDPNEHGQGLVGRRKLTSIAIGDSPIRLKAHAAREGVDRYFKNPNGGLGQYWLGVLFDLGLLSGSTRTGLRYVREAAAPLADGFGAGLAADAFFDAVEKDTILPVELDALSAFCPCRIKGAPEEQAAILDLLLHRTGAQSSEGVQRRDSLQLLLRLACDLEDDGATTYGLSENMLRMCAYSGAMPSGAPWVLPPALEQARRGWATYERNEILSACVQTMFWAALHFALEAPATFASSRRLRDAFVAEVAKPALGVRATLSVREAISDLHGALPPLQNWGNDAHEDQLVGAAINAASGRDRNGAVVAALGSLLALAVRFREVQPYDTVTLIPEYLRSYPVNLASFARIVATDAWLDQTLADAVGWFATDWGIDVHLQVAMRKLRYQGNDTFRIRPLDDSLAVVEAPLPGLTSPRMRQAIQILRDVGAVAPNADDVMRATALGRQLAEVSDVG